MTTMFVYGTLKRGYHNNRYMEGQTFLGEAMSIGADYSMSGWGVPFLKDGGDQFVKGELWEVDDQALRKIDRLEGHPNAYRREEREFELIENGVRFVAWVYLMQLRDEREGKYDGEVLEWPRSRDEAAPIEFEDEEEESDEQR